MPPEASKIGNPVTPKLAVQETPHPRAEDKAEQQKLLESRSSFQRVEPKISLLGHLKAGEKNFSDIWGYQAPNGQKYSILTANNGNYIVRMGASPQVTGFFEGPNSLWRDAKTWKHYGYIVTEGRLGGIQIIDLSNPESPRLVNTDRSISTAHNIYIDSKGYLYVMGVDNGWFVEKGNRGLHPEGQMKKSGIRIYDLNSDPTHPVEVARWEGPYVHDIYIDEDRGILYASGIDTHELYAIDITDRRNPKTISGLKSGGPNHSAWGTEDGKILVSNDEKEGGFVRIWNVENPLNLTQVARWNVAGESPHNVIVRDKKAFFSYYNLGLVVADIADPLNPRVVAQFDTNGEERNTLFDGAWGVYLFPDGEILISDIQNGVFHFRYEETSLPPPPFRLYP